MGWEDSAARAKRLHRPSLKNWERDGLVDSFHIYASSILSGGNHPYSYFGIRAGESGSSDNNKRRGVVEELSLSLEEARGLGEDDMMGGKKDGGGYSLYHIKMLQHGHDRPKKRRTLYPVVLDANQLSPCKFHERYESRRIPCVIRGIPYGESSLTEEGRRGEERMTTHLDYEFDGEEKKECRRNDDTRQRLRRDGYDDIDSIAATALTLPTTSHEVEWPAVPSWSISSLLSDPILFNAKFKCGEDDDGHTIRMRLCHFLQYLRHNKDDSP